MFQKSFQVLMRHLPISSHFHVDTKIVNPNWNSES